MVSVKLLFGGQSNHQKTSNGERVTRFRGSTIADISITDYDSNLSTSGNSDMLRAGNRDKATSHKRRVSWKGFKSELCSKARSASVTRSASLHRPVQHLDVPSEPNWSTPDSVSGWSPSLSQANTPALSPTVTAQDSSPIWASPAGTVCQEGEAEKISSNHLDRQQDIKLPLSCPPTSQPTSEEAKASAVSVNHNQHHHGPITSAVRKLFNRVFPTHTHDEARLEDLFESAGVLIGSGTGGTVRLYHRKSDGKPVAVKFFRRDTEQIRRELTLAQTIPPHPHLLDTLGVYRASKATRANALNVPAVDLAAGKVSSSFTPKAPNVPVLVTDFYPQDLFAITERSNDLTVIERNRLFAQLVYAVAHMHQHNIAHRDLKLENACIDKSGALRLVDLGSAASGRDSQGRPILSMKVHGSDPYVSPEALASGKMAEKLEAAQAAYDNSPFSLAGIDAQQRQTSSDPSQSQTTSNEKAVGYDSFAADSWSLGVIYLCLTRRCFHWERADAENDAGFRYFVNRRERFFASFTQQERDILSNLLAVSPKERWSPAELLIRLPWLRAHLTKSEQDPAADSSSTPLTDMEYKALCQSFPNKLPNGSIDLEHFLKQMNTPGHSDLVVPSREFMTSDSCVW